MALSMDMEMKRTAKLPGKAPKATTVASTSRVGNKRKVYFSPDRPISQGKPINDSRSDVAFTNCP